MDTIAAWDRPNCLSGPVPDTFEIIRHRNGRNIEEETSRMSRSDLAPPCFDACDAGEGRDARKCLCTGKDGSVPATGKGDVSEDGDVMLFDGDKIARMTEIRNARHTLRQPGWA